MILLIDNYDSFVYNLYQFLAVEDPDVRLVRNDRITPEEGHFSMEPDAIVISPGPGKPSDAGVCIELIRQLKGQDTDPWSVSRAPGDRGGRSERQLLTRHG